MGFNHVLNFTVKTLGESDLLVVILKNIASIFIPN